MMFVVTTISSMVHIYSVGYICMTNLNLVYVIFIISTSMLILVSSNNLLQLFFGWKV